MKYLEQLLKSEKADWKTFGDICKIKICKDNAGMKKIKSLYEGKNNLMEYIDKLLAFKSTLMIPQKESLSKLYFKGGSSISDETIFETEIDEKIVNPKFAFYYLQLENLAKYNIIRGVSNITENTLNKIPFPVFSLYLQQKIVDLLEEFDKIIGCKDEKLVII